MPRDSEAPQPGSAPGRSILVIDDEEAVLDVVRRFLQIAGHQVAVATNGQAALDLLSNGRPVDLVILDLMMPREDVAATFQRLRQRRPGIPVLLCTGLADAGPAPELLLQRCRRPHPQAVPHERAVVRRPPGAGRTRPT